MSWFRRLWSRFVSAVAAEIAHSAGASSKPEPGRKPIKIGMRARSLAAIQPEMAHDFANNFPIPAPPEAWKGATDAAVAINDAVSTAYAFAAQSAYYEGIGFMGFPYLAELTQRPEYRMITEIRAKEMTREWIELKYTGDEENSELLDQIRDELERFKVQDLFRQMVELDGFFGRGHIYIDMGAGDMEMRRPLLISSAKVRKGDLVALRRVEPMWVYPDAFNATNPLAPHFYQPQSWFVQNKKVHVSRLLTFISREVPDLLKPSYSFAGLSLSQQAKPYVDNWIRTRQSVADLISNFSIIVFLTNLSGLLGGDGGDGEMARIDLFNLMRNNKGTFVADKDTEDLKNLAVPLGTLDALQAQSQEQMASVAQTPLVKLLGITPSGLNASTDGEIRVFYDTIFALQEHLFRAHLTTIIDLLQLNANGKIDPNVTFDFIKLWQLDEAAEASVRKTEVDSDVEYINAGVLDPTEVRKRLASNKDSPYAGLNPDDAPETPMEEEVRLKPDPAKTAEPRSLERSGV